MKQCLACGELFENFDCPRCSQVRRQEEECLIEYLENEISEGRDPLMDVLRKVLAPDKEA